MGFKHDRMVGDDFSCRKARQFQYHTLRRLKRKNFAAVRRKRKLSRMRGIINNLSILYRRNKRIARYENKR